MQSFHSVSAGHVRVAVTPLTGNFDVAGLLSRFRARYPQVTISLSTGLIAELLGKLEAGQVDVVIGPAGAADERQGWQRTEITSERLVLITPLAGRGHVNTLADVVHEPFVCLPSDSGLRHLLNEAFGVIGVEPRVDFETHSPASIREMVAANLGCAIIAQSIVEKQGTAVRVHHIPGLPPHPPISVMSEEEPAPPTARFLEELETTIREHAR